MTIKYEGSITILQTAVEKANALLQDEQFYAAIAQKSGFHFSKASGRQVADSMKKCTAVLSVKTFKKLFTRELGFEDLRDPGSIHINIAGNKLDRSLGSLAGTFIHEAVHAADANDNTIDYHHDGNNAKGNQDTAPYWIGNLAVQMVDHPGKPVDPTDVKPVPHAPEDKMSPAMAGEAGDDANPIEEQEDNFTIDVKVLGGEQPPTAIRVTLDGPSFHKFYTRKSSFTESESLPSGAYDLTIAGSNPNQGRTTADIDGNFDGNPPRHDERSTSSYSIGFSFIIQ